MSSKKATRLPEIPPATQLALLRHLLRLTQEARRPLIAAARSLVEGDLLRDPLPAYTNVAVDFDLLSCRWPRKEL